MGVAWRVACGLKLVHEPRAAVATAPAPAPATLPPAAAAVAAVAAASPAAAVGKNEEPILPFCYFEFATNWPLFLGRRTSYCDLVHHRLLLLPPVHGISFLSLVAINIVE